MVNAAPDARLVHTQNGDPADESLEGAPGPEAQPTRCGDLRIAALRLLAEIRDTGRDFEGDDKTVLCELRTSTVDNLSQTAGTAPNLDAIVNDQLTTARREVLAAARTLAKVERVDSLAAEASLLSAALRYAAAVRSAR